MDAADVLDFEYRKALRRVANEVKPDFWLMGEVVYGDKAVRMKPACGKAKEYVGALTGERVKVSGVVCRDCKNFCTGDKKGSDS